MALSALAGGYLQTLTGSVPTTDAGVHYRSETCNGAAHGWMTADFPVFNNAASDQGWAELLALFDRTLRAIP